MVWQSWAKLHKGIIQGIANPQGVIFRELMNQQGGMPCKIKLKNTKDSGNFYPKNNYDQD